MQLSSRNSPLKTFVKRCSSIFQNNKNAGDVMMYTLSHQSRHYSLQTIGAKLHPVWRTRQNVTQASRQPQRLRYAGIVSSWWSHQAMLVCSMKPFLFVFISYALSQTLCCLTCSGEWCFVVKPQTLSTKKPSACGCVDNELRGFVHAARFITFSLQNSGMCVV